MTPREGHYQEWKMGLKKYEDAATEIRALHGEIVGAMQSSLERALRIGELLAAEKGKRTHGTWLPWVEALPFTERTARRYMRLHRERDRLKSDIVSDLTAAYRLLEAPAEPAEDLPFDLPEPGECMVALLGGDYLLAFVTACETPGAYHIEVHHADDTLSHTQHALSAYGVSVALPMHLEGVDVWSLDWHAQDAEALPETHPAHQPVWMFPDTGQPELNALEAEYWGARVRRDGEAVRDALCRIRQSGLWSEQYREWDWYVHGRLGTRVEYLESEYGLEAAVA